MFSKFSCDNYFESQIRVKHKGYNSERVKNGIFLSEISPIYGFSVMAHPMVSVLGDQGLHYSRGCWGLAAERKYSHLSHSRTYTNTETNTERRIHKSKIYTKFVPNYTQNYPKPRNFKLHRVKGLRRLTRSGHTPIQTDL